MDDMKYNVYSKINRFYEIINDNCNDLTYNEKNLIIEEFKKLNFSNLHEYYKKTNRTNLLNLTFVLWKILSLKKIYSVQFNDNKHIKKYDNALQNMLWDLLIK